MSASNVFSTLRRSTPSIVNCFRNAQLYHGEGCGQNKELIVLFTWLGAKQKYAHKYANCWTARGHDVLHVTTSVRDLLFPRTGAEVTASRVVDFMDQRNSNVIVHGLSVGGYLTQRVLMAAQDSVVNISHQIYDSFTHCVGLVDGVQNAVAPRYRHIARSGAKVYVKFADLSSIYEALHFATNSPKHVPTLFIHSLADKVAFYPHIECIISAQEKVSPVLTYLIPEQQKVPHVTIMKHMGEQKYNNLITSFVDKHRGLTSPEDLTPSRTLQYHTVNSSVTTEYLNDEAQQTDRREAAVQ